MNLKTVLGVWSLLTLGAAGSGTNNDSPKESHVGGTKRYILELSKNSALERLKSELATHEGTKIFKTFESEVFTGVSVETTAENADSLRILQTVHRVWQSRKVQMASVMNGKTFDSHTSAANYSIHSMTGVDKLHEAGILGQGVKVAVVDAGIDYNHPALGGGIGPDFKVLGGYDLVGRSRWPQPGFDKLPDNDPMELNTIGHGTHVSGIIAGKTENWQGVAPEANILSYKVFGDDGLGQTDEETLIEAFLRAHADGADIITSSIGGRGGFASNAWAEVASRLVDQGLVVTISAGNDGDNGLFFPDNGMSGRNVIAVASVEPNYVPGMPFEVMFNTRNHTSRSSWGFFHGSLVHNFPINGTLRVITLSDDPRNVTVGCRYIPPRAEFAGRLVIVPKGGCSGFQKRYNLQNAGAEHVLFFNDDKLFPLPDDWMTRGAEGVMGHDDGVAVIQAIADGVQVTARFFNETEAPLINMKNPRDAASIFTSMGGLYDLTIKPDIAAPGSNIFSTVRHGQYGVKSGTSMATPYVAGIAALYIGKYGGRWVHGRDFGKKLSARIVASGSAVGWHDGLNSSDYDTFAPVFQLGNGLVNATKVLEYRTALSWGAKFALNDTAHFESCHRVNITNNCTTSVTYEFALRASGGFEALSRSSVFNLGPGASSNFVPIEMTPDISFPEGRFSVGPGQTKEATFHFKPPKGLNETALPVYSGQILITGSNDEKLSIPYMGIGSNLQKNFRQMFTDGFPYILSTRNLTTIKDKSTFSFDLSPDAQDFPKLFVEVRWGAPIIRWDIFERGWKEDDWTYPPVPGKDGYVGMAAPWDNEWFAPYFNPEIHNEMDIIRGPLTELSRDVFGYAGYRFWWLGRLTDGFRIGPGNYTMRIAALIPFGDATRSDHWDIYNQDFKVVLHNKTLSSGFSAKKMSPPVPLHA